MTTAPRMQETTFLVGDHIWSPTARTSGKTSWRCLRCYGQCVSPQPPKPEPCPRHILDRQHSTPEGPR